ncbi:NAD-dependent succinate-semialdehyde dehydrogenase [Tessaracoccus sp. OH4464_COT-324]|uniref:NAD-dependent succinate-semialdehyde dehydrogenase n=1 Tax=Tessaracoccus sp. OH4464_COT-324 TaxID=2491059 RepID=UPI000F63014E|nr:NAD-dependent succinate-semialdehyde dehydrogenase [Tessaracoccus sp. OH4464_COT-324]RRD45690.1 NAD-dependent succinate-semialdehyde dehydrogenase [Tessaracoccus sp. OH4464_COT-324]
MPMPACPTQHHIGGRWLGEPTLTVTDPATGQPLARVPDADAATALSALDAAAAAQPSWAATEPRTRAEILRRAFDLIVADRDGFALLMALEMGKPIAEARSEVTYGAEFLRWFSEEAVRIHGRYGLSPQGASRIITERVPVGPVYAVTPWNFPLAMAARKIAPALAAGCTVVLKPALAAPLTSLRLVEVLGEAGLPAGVVNVFTTADSAGVSAALLSDRRLRKLTFTGSTEVGRRLLGLSAGNVLRTSMELGGNAPFIVLPDADVEQAVAGALVAKMRNNGQACTAANRFYVHASLADEFRSRLVAALSAWRVGPGVEKETQLGALISREAVAGIVGLIDDALARGATLDLGGRPGDGPGAFLPPTVLSDVPPGARVVVEEIFGPVVALQTFAEVDEVIARANDTDHGLVGYVFGEERSAMDVARRLESGMVGVNTGLVSNPAAPFGGVKHSGLGREGSFEGIDEYLETKYYGVPL